MSKTKTIFSLKSFWNSLSKKEKFDFIKILYNEEKLADWIQNKNPQWDEMHKTFWTSEIKEEIPDLFILMIYNAIKWIWVESDDNKRTDLLKSLDFNVNEIDAFSSIRDWVDSNLRVCKNLLKIKIKQFTHIPFLVSFIKKNIKSIVFNQYIWENSFLGGEIVEGISKGKRFIGKVTRASKNNVTNPKSVRVTPIGKYAIYGNVYYTVPKIMDKKGEFVSGWGKSNTLLPLTIDEIESHYSGNNIRDIWKKRNQNNIHNYVEVTREYQINLQEQYKKFINLIEKHSKIEIEEKKEKEKPPSKSKTEDKPKPKKEPKEKPIIKIQPKIKKEKQYTAQDIISKEWDLTTSDDDSIISDIDFVFDNLKYFFTNTKHLKFEYIEKDKIYKASYIPDKTNTYIISRLDNIIAKIINKETTLTDLTFLLNEIMDGVEKIETPKPKKKIEKETEKETHIEEEKELILLPIEEEIEEEVVSVKKGTRYNENFITNLEIQHIDDIWASLSQDEQDKLIEYLGIRFQTPYDYHSSIGKQNVINAIKQLQKLTTQLGILKVDIVNGEVQIKESNLKYFWDKITSSYRDNILRYLGKYKRIYQKTITSQWDDIPKSTKDTLKKNLVEFKTLLIKYDTLGLKKSQTVKKKFIPKSTKLISKPKKKMTIDELKKQLDDNIVAILCDKINKGQKNEISYGVLKGKLYNLGYTMIDLAFGSSYDPSKFNDALDSLKNSNMLDAYSGYKGRTTIYSIQDQNTFDCTQYRIVIPPIDFPLLEDFKGCDPSRITTRPINFDIGEKAILQIMCSNSRFRGKTAGMMDFNLQWKWIEFFKSTYKLPHQKKDWNYLVDEKSLNNENMQKDYFRKCLDNLKNLDILFKAQYKGKDSIRWKKDYDFIWKTYKLGVFYQDMIEINDDSIYIDEDVLASDKELQNYKHIDDLTDLIQKTPRFYLLGMHELGQTVNYMIYDYIEFARIEFIRSKSLMFDNPLGLSRNKISKTLSIIKAYPEWINIKTKEKYNFQSMFDF